MTLYMMMIYKAIHKAQMYDQICLLISITHAHEDGHHHYNYIKLAHSCAKSAVVYVYMHGAAVQSVW